MATTKITDLTAYTDPVNTDVLPIVDVTSDVTKKVSIANLLKNASLGTAALPGIAFDGDPNTGLYSPGADQVAISTSGSGRLFVNNSGQVGIGTPNPQSLLHLETDGTALRIVRGSSIGFVYNTGTASTDPFRIQSNGGAVDLYSASSQPITFSAGTTEKARIDSSGRLLVGTISTASSGGVSAQHAFSHSVSSQWAAAVQHTTAAGNAPFGLAIKYTAATPNSTSSDFLFCEDATAVRARFYSNGGLGNYSANDVNLSDINTKKDISPAAGTWDCIKEWEIVNYRYKDQPDDADLNLGVIAQQVVESCPEVITVFEEAKDDQPEKLGIKEQQMYWMAIKALQEAQVRIEQLEAKVAALEAA